MGFIDKILLDNNKNIHLLFGRLFYKKEQTYIWDQLNFQLI